MKLDLNRAILSAKPLNQLVNELIETAEPPTPNTRQYLGASAIRLGMPAEHSISIGSATRNFRRARAISLRAGISSRGFRAST